MKIPGEVLLGEAQLTLKHFTSSASAGQSCVDLVASAALMIPEQFKSPGDLGAG